jgi:hypothetical protein
MSSGAFMAWARARARCGLGRMAATRKRRADRRAQCGEREADRWDPAAVIFFKLKLPLDENSSKQIATSCEKFQENSWGVENQIWNTFYT